MRELTKEEHLELMAFLSDKAKQLYKHEVKEAIKAGREPKNVYQSIFSRQQCFAHEIDDVTVYRIYTKGFLKFVRVVLPEITEKDPDVFRNRDARDILEDLYNVSGYSIFHKTPNEYIENILDEACVYVVLKTESGFDDKVLRIDLCRGVSPSMEDNKKYVFRGGLLHAAKHFRIDDSAAVDSTFDLEHLVWLCSNAFLQILPDNKTKYTICLPYNETHSIQFGFYKEAFSRVFYVNTIYPINNCTIESFSTNGKYGLRNQRGGVIVPCKYDEINFDEKSKCYLCKRDGVFFENGIKDISYTGVRDLYSNIGEFLLGGFDVCQYLPQSNIFLCSFGRVWIEERHSGHFSFGDAHTKWLMLDQNMKSIWGNECFRGQIIRKNDDNTVAIPESCSFVDFVSLNDNQIAISQNVDYFWPESSPYRIVFTTEHSISEEHRWFYPVTQSIAFYLGDDDKLGVIGGTSCSQAVYDYISAPYKGWCIGIIKCHEDNKSAALTGDGGKCVLINTFAINTPPLVLYQNMTFHALEEYIKKKWSLLCDIEDAEKCTERIPIITIPEQLYKSSVLNADIRNDIKCGLLLRLIANKFDFISAKHLEKEKREYTTWKFPREPMYVRHLDSPLDAFEGDGALYNEWLNS